jgi:hypothetical protein
MDFWLLHNKRNEKCYISLTVHLGIILVNNQLDKPFSMYLFPLSTCFEQPSAHHQENWIVSIHHLVYVTVWYAGPSWSAYQAVTYTEWHIADAVLIKFCSSDDEHWVARNMQRRKINKYIKEYVSSLAAQWHIYVSYRTANLQSLHFIYLFNKYTNWIF